MAQGKVEVSEFLGNPYNYDEWRPKREEFAFFKAESRAGERAPDFRLPTLDGEEVSLSSLRGKPVVIEFGSIT